MYRYSIAHGLDHGCECSRIIFAKRISYFSPAAARLFFYFNEKVNTKISEAEDQLCGEPLYGFTTLHYLYSIGFTYWKWLREARRNTQHRKRENSCEPVQVCRRVSRPVGCATMRFSQTHRYLMAAWRWRAVLWGNPRCRTLSRENLRSDIPQCKEGPGCASLSGRATPILSIYVHVLDRDTVVSLHLFPEKLSVAYDLLISRYSCYFFFHLRKSKESHLG